MNRKDLQFFFKKKKIVSFNRLTPSIVFGDGGGAERCRTALARTRSQKWLGLDGWLWIGIHWKRPISLGEGASVRSAIPVIISHCFNWKDFKFNTALLKSEKSSCWFVGLIFQENVFVNFSFAQLTCSECKKNLKRQNSSYRESGLCVIML